VKHVGMYVAMLLVGIALGAATVALAAPGRVGANKHQARPICAGVQPLAAFNACYAVRNWCPYFARWGPNMADEQVKTLLQHLTLACPRQWRH
jgi:hypothetical protein